MQNGRREETEVALEIPSLCGPKARHLVIQMILTVQSTKKADQMGLNPENP